MKLTFEEKTTLFKIVKLVNSESEVYPMDREQRQELIQMLNKVETWEDVEKYFKQASNMDLCDHDHIIWQFIDLVLFSKLNKT
jgi:hypothetical protein